MHLSREAEYALSAMIHLAQQPPEAVLTLSQIAEARGLPAGFLAKTFQKLVRHGLLESFRGRQRGYRLAREASEINMRELLEAIEGPDIFERCIFWGRRCGESTPCLLHEGWREIKPHLIQFLEMTSLTSLAQNSAFDHSHADA